MDRNIKGYIFDLDGVLVDTSRYHYIAWRHIADEIGVYFDETINERLKGVDRLASLEILLERSNRIYNQEEKEEIAKRKNEDYLKSISRITPDDLYPGVEALMKRMKNMGIKIALGSASKNARAIIEKLKIVHFFNEIVDANKIVKSKPDPEIFVRAADSLGLGYQECAVVEDSIAGLISARSAGMFAIGIGRKDILSLADIVYCETQYINMEEVEQRRANSFRP